MTQATDAAFEPPGYGQWALDRSHFPGATTPILERLMIESISAGNEKSFAELGVPAKRIDGRFVHGYMYTRLIPLIGADQPPRKLPPDLVLKLMTRLHPEFRRRTRAAAAALNDRPFRRVLDDWTNTIRPELVARNLTLQSVSVDGVGDEELSRHVGELIDHLRENMELHFYLHGYDLGPIARYLHAAIGWGLEPAVATDALAGASPSTSLPIARLVRLRELTEASGRDFTTLDEVRALSPEANRLLDEHLAEHGHVMATGYDLTSFTLAELPGVLLGSIRAAVPPPDYDSEFAAELRNRVPANSREEFDGLLADARSVMDMRDSNGPQTVEWPTGLLRRALLAVGRRLVTMGSLHEADHALELTVDEARVALRDELPGADEIAGRSAQRLSELQLDPPPLLGPDEPKPPLEVMPKVLAEAVAMVQTALVHLGMDGAPTVDPLVGVGIGQRVYTGRVCAAESADEAIEKLQPGDVLVVRATSPAFNAVLGIAGAVVTANGGALSHAAVLARELGITALVGAPGALDIPDGSTVTVDPIAGRVEVS